MWRLLLLLLALGILGLVIRNVVILLHGYRPPKKSLPPRRPEPDVEEAEFREANSSDG